MQNSTSHTKLLTFLIVFIAFTVIFSCTKITFQPGENEVKENEELSSASLMQRMNGIHSVPFDLHLEDSIERKTILGMRLTNPYLIATVKQAYTNLGLDPAKGIVNNLYVRFLPANVEQLNRLDSIMEINGVELFDTPIDYEVLVEGDYYQDPSIPEENITWQYAVVLPSFSFPPGIQHETPAQIHIPADDYTAVETEAERLAAIQDSINFSYRGPSATLQPNNADYCEPGWYWDPRAKRCIPREVDPPLPPGPAPDAAIPGGLIQVFDTNFGINLPVQKARMVARRWFKTDRTYTNNHGFYNFNKRFKNKVTILVKFKNDDAQIRNVRGVRLGIYTVTTFHYQGLVAI